MRRSAITHQFVHYVPEQLVDGVVYISLEHATAAHRCMCGCGEEVVTPLSATDWRLIYDGESISLEPSIGNWSFPCRSHYWITGNRVMWAASWSADQIKEGRRLDRNAKALYYKQLPKTRALQEGRTTSTALATPRRSWLRRFFRS